MSELNLEIVNDSIFGRQMASFMHQFEIEGHLDEIPEEHRDEVRQLMALSAFHISMAARVYFLHILKQGGPDCPMMKDFIHDTDRLFNTIGLDLEQVLDAAMSVHPGFSPSNMVC